MTCVRFVLLRPHMKCYMNTPSDTDQSMMEGQFIPVLALFSSLPLSSPLFNVSFFPSLPPAYFSVDFLILSFTSRVINRLLQTSATT